MSQMAEMGRLTKDLSQLSKFRTSAIDEMRRATEATLAACATVRGEVMHGYRAQTQKFLASLVKDVSAHRRAAAKQVMQISHARQRAATQLHAALGREARSLAERTHEFRDAAAKIAPAFGRAHRKMAKQQKTSLESGRRKLGGEVAKLRSAMRRDLTGAHDIWSAFTLAQSTRKH